MIPIDNALEYLKIGNKGTEYYNIVDNFINEITALIENYCNTKILVSNTEMIFGGDNFTYQRLSKANIKEITALSSRASAFDSWVVIDNDNYVLEKISTYYNLIISTSYQKGNTYKLELIEGFELSEIPNDIVLVAKEMLFIKFNNWKNNTLGLASQGQSELGTNINTVYEDLTNNHKMILNKYRRSATLSCP